MPALESGNSVERKSETTSTRLGSDHDERCRRGAEEAAEGEAEVEEERGRRREALGEARIFHRPSARATLADH